MYVSNSEDALASMEVPGSHGTHQPWATCDPHAMLTSPGPHVALAWQAKETTRLEAAAKQGQGAAVAATPTSLCGLGLRLG